MKLVLIVMKSYYKINKVVVTLRGTASHLCLISRVKFEFFLFDWSQTFHEIVWKKRVMSILLILTEAFKKLKYLSLFLQVCNTNNVMLSDEEEDFPRKLVWVVWSGEWESVRVPKLCSVGRQKWRGLWRSKVKGWRISRIFSIKFKLNFPNILKIKWLFWVPFTPKVNTLSPGLTMKGEKC